MASDDVVEISESQPEERDEKSVKLVHRKSTVKVRVKAKKEGEEPAKKSPERTRTPRTKKKEETADLFSQEIPAAEANTEQEPETSAEAEGMKQEVPAEVIAADTAAEESTGETAEAAPEAEAKEETAQKEADDSQAPRTDKKTRFSAAGGKFQKKGRRLPVQNGEPVIPDVNLDENPDAPKLFISDLTVLPLDTLRHMAREKGISEDVILDCRKQDLIREMAKLHAQSGGALMTEGVLEILAEGYGLIRYAVNSYVGGTEDVYVSHGMLKACGLRTGDTVYGQVRSPRDNERFIAMIRVITVNGISPQEAKLRVPFDSLTPLFPDEKLHLEYASDPSKPEDMDLSTRVVDLFSPIGKGQRSLIVAPPRTGKTVLMQKIANAITTNHPEVKLIVLLVDERPEEVTDMRRNVKAEVVASTFDEQATRHVQVAEMVIEKAKRLVEQHQDVVILLDSITRLARAYNQTVPASGKILSGGVDSNALHKPKRFFGAARNIENGGSLTIISTALIETGSRMDEVIFEEFKGTGNNEIVLDRRMADSRKFPAINLKKSGTRRDDLLLSKDELARLWLLRNAVANMDDNDMSVFLIDKMRKTHNNKEFLSSMSTGAAAGPAFTASSSYK